MSYSKRSVWLTLFLFLLAPGSRTSDPYFSSKNVRVSDKLFLCKDLGPSLVEYRWYFHCIFSGCWVCFNISICLLAACIFSLYTLGLVCFKRRMNCNGTYFMLGCDYSVFYLRCFACLFELFKIC